MKRFPDYFNAKLGLGRSKSTFEEKSGEQILISASFGGMP